MIKKFTFENKKLRSMAFKIRHEVFVIGQNCPHNLEYEAEEDSIHFLLFKDSKPIATARYRNTELGIKLERFAVLSSYRGKGYGMMILRAIIKDLNNEKKIKYLHAQFQVVQFYEKIGFEKIGDQFEEAGIIHYKMILKD